LNLDGARVVITRPERGAEALATSLERCGARIVRMPVIVISDPSSWDALDRALERLEAGFYEWVLFASVNGVERVLQRRPDAPEVVRRARVAAVGPATAAELRRQGVHPDLVPSRHAVTSLAEALGDGPGRILFPRVEHGPALPPTFDERGWSADEVPAYRNSPAPRSPMHAVVERGEFDVVVFASPSAIDAFVATVAWEPLGLRPRSRARRTVACIGPTTAARATSRGMRVDVVPAEHTAQGLVRALIESNA
jgi:uroporphyrinogen III methyltransferase/synthase